jgi:hypothetical protein
MRSIARSRCSAEPGSKPRSSLLGPGSAAHHAARHSASKTRVNALMARRSVRGTPWCTRNDVKTHIRSPAARCARAVHEFFALRTSRAWGMPGARCTRSLVCAWGNKYAHEYSQRVHRKSPGIPARNGLRLTPRSPRRRIRLATVVGELTASPRPVGPTCLRQLNTSNGCQDHTALPSASAPFVSSPGDRSQAKARPAIPLRA